MARVKVKLTDHLASERFASFTAREMLIWLYIAEHGAGAYTTRDLAAALHARQPNVSTGLKRLVAAGLLEPLEGVRQGRAAQYRAILPEISGAS